MLINGLRLLARVALFRRLFLAGGFHIVWYLAQNPDVKASGVDPMLHYVLSGCREGRDPHPRYSTSGRDANFQSGQCMWLVWSLLKGYKLEQVAWQAGSIEYNAELPSLVVFAHQCEPQLYGAERSLLDHLSLLANLDINVCVVLPSAKNQFYVDQIQRLSSRFVVMPMPWWQSGRAIENDIVADVVQLLGQVNRPAVYCNTSVLWEPFVAAQKLNLPTYVHVREVFAHDQSLCTALNATAAQAISHVEQSCSKNIVNSQFTGRQFSQSHVVPNVVWPIAKVEKPRSKPLTVAMLSSNIAKKGVKDFFKVAALLQGNTDLNFCLVGPITEEVERCQIQFGNVVDVMGYVDVAEALPEVDVVVSLSHFAESFGRTIAEAMAYGKVVIAYDFGAVNELIIDRKTGFLVEYKSTDAVAETLLELVSSDSLYQSIASEARQSISQQFGPESVVEKFTQGFHQWLG